MQHTPEPLLPACPEPITAHHSKPNRVSRHRNDSSEGSGLGMLSSSEQERALEERQWEQP